MADEQAAAEAAAASTAGNDANDGADAKSATSTLAEGGCAACDELVEATMADPGAPFAPDVVRDLAQLKRADRARFETLRTRLKRAGCRVTELDLLIGEANGEERNGRPSSQADVLVALAEAAELFQTPDEVAYADIEVNRHRETWPVKSHGFRRWLRRRFFEELDGAPNSEAFTAALGVIEAKAQHDTPIREVFVRVGEHGGKIYLDLCDAGWRAIEVDEVGWSVVDRPAARFRRSRDMRALPEPKSDGSVDGLRPLLNISKETDGDDDFILAIAYALACLRPRGPYPVGAIGGEQGTAKSTRSAMLRNLIDPRHPSLRGLPRDERDLVVAARSQHVLAFDNVSGLRPWLSDALCRIASGAGFGTRELYTDAEEVVFSGARPVILNGITEIVGRPDLAERAIFATCEPIDSKNRLSEEEVWASFDDAHASILGALLDAVATGLRHLPEIRPPDLPRMADFAHWAMACEPALWKNGDFFRAYTANILGAIESVLEASPVAVAVREMMTPVKGDPPVRTVALKQWDGTAAALLDKLTNLVAERVARSDAWPGNGRALSGQLRRAASFLRKVGINVVFARDALARRIVITATTPPAGVPADKGNFTSSSSFASSSGAAPSRNNGLGASYDDARQLGDDAERAADDANDDANDDAKLTGTGRADRPGVYPNSLKTNDVGSGAGVNDANVVNDAKIPTPQAREGVREQREAKAAGGREALRTLYEFFAGGGLARIALDPDWRCEFANDIAPEKARSYAKNFGHEELKVCNVAHLTTADLPGVADLAWASPPCVGASLAGGRKGLGPEAWAFLRLMQDLCTEGRRPRLITIENVPDLLTSLDGADFDRICDTLMGAGYRYGVLVVDASLFTPQSRRRLFIVAVDKALPIPNEIVADGPSLPFHPPLLVKALRRQKEQPLWFKLPAPPTRNTILADLIEDQPPIGRWDTQDKTNEKIATMNADNLAKLEAMKRAGKRMIQGFFWRGGRPGPNGKVSRWEVRDDDIAGCLRTASGGSSVQSILVVDGDTVRSRRLTPRECARLMGLPASYILPDDSVEGFNLTGDGVVPQVVRHLAEHLFEPLLASPRAVTSEGEAML